MSRLDLKNLQAYRQYNKRNIRNVQTFVGMVGVFMPLIKQAPVHGETAKYDKQRVLFLANDMLMYAERMLLDMIDYDGALVIQELYLSKQMAEQEKQDASETVKP